jgi:hypothetical protein
MSVVTFDLREFERAARSIAGAKDQVRFAVSRSLNMSLVATENRLAAETWPSAVKVRNKGFLKAALKPEFSTKANLTGKLYDSLGRAHLKLHAKGGTKTAKSQFAIPTRAVRRTSHGVAKSQLPRAIPHKDKVVKGGLIFQAKGKGKRRKLQLLYRLARVTHQPADVPFYRSFDQFMREEMRRQFSEQMRRAMATRRK